MSMQIQEFDIGGERVGYRDERDDVEQTRKVTKVRGKTKRGMCNDEVREMMKKVHPAGVVVDMG
jgi:hypothetical protein